MYELLVWIRWIHIPVLRRYEMCKQSILHWNRHPRPFDGVRLPPPLLGSMALVPKWSPKMLKIPPVPFGIPCSQKCLPVAVGTTLPWPWESLETEFKRPVFQISKTTAANVKLLYDAILPKQYRLRWSIKRTTLGFFVLFLFFFQADLFFFLFFTASWLALNLASYQLTKQMSSFSKKLCFVCSCFECKLSKLPFTTMSQPTTEIYIHIQHRMNVDWLAISLRVMSFKKSPWRNKSSEVG